MKRFSHWMTALCLTAACSSPKPEPAAPTSTAEPAVEPTPSVPVPSESSDALRVVNPTATVVIRVRGDRIRSGPMFGTIRGIRDSIPEVRQGLMFAQGGCGFDPIEAIQEVVIGAEHEHMSSPEEPLGRIRLDPSTATAAVLLNRPAEDALACIQNFIPVQRTTIGDNKALVLPTGGTLQARRDLLIYTPQADAEAAAKRIASGAALDPELQGTLDANPGAAALAFARGANTLGLKWGSLALSQPNGGFELKAVGLAESEATATELVKTVQSQLERARQEVSALSATTETEQVTKLLDEVRVERSGSTVGVSLSLDKARAESLFSDVLVALVREGVGRYALSAKTAEARDNVMRIALALSDYARAQKPGAAPFPPSAPLSPAVVPGKRPVSATESFEHPSWQAVHFAPRGPVFYSYEFVTAPGGKSVEVIAHGDLDGDGKESRYSVSVTMQGKEPRISPDLDRQDPFE